MIILGVGDLGATCKAGEAIKTIGLGSCVAVIIMDRISRCIGMVHVALPESATNLDHAKRKPGHFADTGIPALLQAMKEAGSSASGTGKIVKLVGGANVMDPHNTFNIGKRNILAIKKILWKYGMGAIAEDLGGNIGRTVVVDVDEGRVKISSSHNQKEWEI